jgi:hypothetical protein
MPAKLKALFLLALPFIFLSAFQRNTSTIEKGTKAIKIQWVDDSKGDFSFRNEWSYEENIFPNSCGQLGCDVFCPEEIDRMQTESGCIIQDSLEAFYKLVDTTHQYHTISCDAWCYEYGGTDFIEARHLGKDTAEAYTMCNAGTHCSLALLIVGNYCTPVIDLNSVADTVSRKFACTGGYIKIDKTAWSKDTLKAVFSFGFYNHLQPHYKLKMFWKGKIYAPVRQREVK